MAITTTTILQPAVQEALNAILISTPTPNYIHTIAAMKKRMPKNQGGTMVIRGFNDIDSATVPLGNTGVTPPSQQLTAFDLRAEVSYYGTYIEINEQVN